MQKVLLIVSVGSEVGRSIQFNKKGLVSGQSTRVQMVLIILRTIQLNGSQGCQPPVGSQVLQFQHPRLLSVIRGSPVLFP